MRFSSLIIGAILAGNAAEEGSPTIIGGEGEKVNLSSGDTEVQPRTNGGGETTRVISYDGASYITVHFSQFDFPSGCEMTVTDSGGGQSYAMSGQGRQGLGDFWARQINGDTMMLTISCDKLSKMGKAVYKIDEQVHGFPEALDSGL